MNSDGIEYNERNYINEDSLNQSFNSNENSGRDSKNHSNLKDGTNELNLNSKVKNEANATFEGENATINNFDDLYEKRQTEGSFINKLKKTEFKEDNHIIRSRVSQQSIQSNNSNIVLTEETEKLQLKKDGSEKKFGKVGKSNGIVKTVETRDGKSKKSLQNILKEKKKLVMFEENDQVHNFQNIEPERRGGNYPGISSANSVDSYITHEENNSFDRDVNEKPKLAAEKENFNIEIDANIDLKIEPAAETSPEKNQEITETPVEESQSLKKRIHELMNHWITTIVFTVLTFYALFSDDVKTLTTDKTYDNGFDYVVIIILIVFLAEAIISCIVDDEYLWSFFFWLDAFSILSMTLDISQFNDFIIHMMSATNSNANQALGATSIARAGRGARLGSRAIRILRILKLVRLVRIAKLYKSSEKLKDSRINEKEKKEKEDLKKSSTKTENEKGENGEQEEEDLMNMKIPEETKVGKKLTDLTTKRVIVLVLSMIASIIVFDPKFYYSATSSMEYGIEFFESFTDPNDPNILLMFNIYIEQHKNISTPIVYAKVWNLEYQKKSLTDNFRIDEILEFNSSCANFLPDNQKNTTDDLCTAIFDNRNVSKTGAGLNIAKTIFICVILTLGSMFFSSDTNDLVLEPVESMIRQIKLISKDPVEAMYKAEEEEFGKWFLQEENAKNCCKCTETNSKELIKVTPLETIILEKTIKKIGALLALGFGRVGADILGEKDAEEGDLIDLKKGKKIVAIYSFCNIRNFTLITEILQDNILVVLNEIAEIIHNVTNDYLGFLNKNVGDSFLLLWKFPKRCLETDENPDEDSDLTLNDLPMNVEIIDLSIVSLIKIHIKLNTSAKLNKFKKYLEIVDDYPKLGFGLHYGWSIEGAMGSTFKIDSSYLSSHVNLTKKLEKKTKEYDAIFIISEFIVEKMSLEARKHTRILDTIQFCEQEEPISIYTIDVNISCLKIDSEADEKNKEQESEYGNNEYKFQRYLNAKKRKELLKEIEDGNHKVWENFIKNDVEFQKTRKIYTFKFYEEYNLGFEEYRKGNWEDARTYFENAHMILNNENQFFESNNKKELNPCKGVLEFMESWNYQPPSDWQGYRIDY